MSISLPAVPTMPDVSDVPTVPNTPAVPPSTGLAAWLRHVAGAVYRTGARAVQSIARALGVSASSMLALALAALAIVALVRASRA